MVANEARTFAVTVPLDDMTVDYMMAMLLQLVSTSPNLHSHLQHHTFVHAPGRTSERVLDKYILARVRAFT